MIELVSEKDCVAGNRNRKGNNNKKGKILNKKISNRDRNRCYNCGHDNGRWYEQLIKGKREYHFLCQDCIDVIESAK